MKNTINVNEVKEVRKKNILTIDAIESLTGDEEGLNLNEGYDYAVNGPLAQVADGLAKLLIELDKESMTRDNTKTGEGLLVVLTEYYKLYSSESSNN